jgi:hypothetical protein
MVKEFISEIRTDTYKVNSATHSGKIVRMMASRADPQLSVISESLWGYDIYKLVECLR